MIKNIIFGFDGVLLNSDYELTYSRLSEVMGVEIDSKQVPAHIFKIMLGYEKGEINTETFLWNLQKVSSKLTPQPDKLIKAWNARLLGWNPDRFEFLSSLKDKFSLFLLSNCNDLHLEWIRKDLKRKHQIIDFDTRFFNKTYYSHNIHLRKPEGEIYEKVLEDANIKAEETLYIDENEENVEKALQVGLNAVCHNPEKEIMDVFHHYLEAARQ
ncbi:MAG: HAD-IA family hydrolase [Saprospiraceae bacterium]|nr:HAD-IA family hydrolase [Saprospiraceae bacterium]